MNINKLSEEVKTAEPLGIRYLRELLWIALLIELVTISYQLMSLFTQEAFVFGGFIFLNALELIVILALILSILCLGRRVRMLYPVPLALIAVQTIRSMSTAVQSVFDHRGFLLELTSVTMTMFYVHIFVYLILRVNYLRGVQWNPDDITLQKQERLFLRIAGVLFFSLLILIFIAFVSQAN